MKILYLLADFPYPLTNGTRVQTFNLLKFMTRDHECFIISFCNDDGHKWIKDFQRALPCVHILGLFPRRSGLGLQVGRILHLLRGNPVFLARWENDAFVRAVGQAFGDTDYDLVHLEGISMVPYLYLCQTKPTVLSTIDAISMAQRRTADALKQPLRRAYRLFAAWSVGHFERKNLSKATKLHVVSQPDCQYLRSHIHELDVENIEIVIPEELINYQLLSPKVEGNKPHNILFTGLLSADGIAKGLLHFLSNSYPAITKACPGVQMVVLGQNAPLDVQKRIESMPNVQYVSWAEDYYAELVRSQVIVFPDLTGTGIKNRVLQAMALAKAIVGTPVVFEGIPIKDGVHCFERKTDEGFSQAVLVLLKDAQLREQMGALARQLVLDKFRMDTLGLKWLSLYNSAIMKFRRGR